jgi:hypothetical protein
LVIPRNAIKGPWALRESFDLDAGFTKIPAGYPLAC